MRAGRQADGRVLGRRRRDRDLPRHGLGRPHLRPADRRRGVVHGGRRRSAGCEQPVRIKALGDRIFCEGINRFIFHRYAHQPWTDAAPGMTMGPWGVHYERTQTWWDWTRPWLDYVARCQYMLRQGRFVADICYLQAEASPQGFHNHRRDGYDWDECGADVVLNRMTVRTDGSCSPTA